LRDNFRSSIHVLSGNISEALTFHWQPFNIHHTAVPTSGEETRPLIERSQEADMVARVLPSPYDDEGYWTTRFREARHNPCLMAPLSLFLFVIFALFFLLTLLFQFPTLLLGLLLSPLLQRAPWYIEFLYPFGIAKWGHFFLMRGSNSKFLPGRKDDKNRGFHSRTAEQKFEVIPGRVYIHPIPQFVDNLGYLVVCLPRPKMDSNGNKLHKKNPKKPKAKEAPQDGNDGGDNIVALLVDCGDANATLAAVKLIESMHYSKRKIHIQVICSTHKHHDHTGGNKDLMQHEDRGKSIERVYGGAVERVPQCTHPVANGDMLTLPQSASNDMNELVEMEVVAVPGHTRGSVVYTLRCKTAVVEKAVEYMFTGDTMFSAGGGVPFEADIGLETESKLNKSNGNTFVRMGLGQASIERCFAEILSRALPDVHGDDTVGDRILIFPGHEYTAELLSRQFQASISESSKWKNFPPEEFFETVSQMYVALHRRSLPHNSGKLLAIPSTINREVIISPNFRGMRRNAELVVRAVVFWHTHFCKNPVKEEELNSKASKLPNGKQKKSTAHIKTESLPNQWNLDFHDVGREIFTTVYTADLESVLDDLSSGKIKKQKAIKQLQELKWKLRDPVINRRAIPNALPSDKLIYQGVAALALLGSPPSAMSLTDSRKMNLAPPIDSNSDRILVSKKRLILVLERLGALGGDEQLAVDMVKQLWIEASEFMSPTGTDMEVASASSGERDKIELGVLKWVLYGIPANQPSWFSKACCMPCSSVPPPREFPGEHPAMSMKKKGGNLVAHDVFTCPLCRDATGCAFAEEDSVKGPDSPKRGFNLTETFSDESNESGFEIEGLAQQLLRGGSSP
jgi:glyoxylase-like metal-dependent hydrolase (beta-lactamase superfamily II)